MYEIPFLIGHEVDYFGIVISQMGAKITFEEVINWSIESYLRPCKLEYRFML